MDGHIVPILGQARMRDLHAEHLRLLLQPHDRRGTSTLKKHRRLLKRALGHAAQSDISAANPCDAVEMPRIRRRREARALNEREVATLFGTVSGSAIEGPVRFAVATGVRKASCSPCAGTTWTWTQGP